MAAAYMVLKQTPRARNQLKRASKSIWTIQVIYPMSVLFCICGMYLMIIMVKLFSFCILSYYDKHNIL